MTVLAISILFEGHVGLTISADKEGFCIIDDDDKKHYLTKGDTIDLCGRGLELSVFAVPPEKAGENK